MIGRALRACCDLNALGPWAIIIDCDVLQADGGTRTASITGAFVALYDALEYLKKTGAVRENPVKDYLAAVSVGIYKGVPILDLTYQEDSEAEVDMNLVMTGKGEFVEIQGTAEHATFSREKLEKMLALGEKGVKELVEFQRRIVGEI